MNDIFLLVPDIDITNYADDTTPHGTSKTVDSLIEILEENTNEIIKWFKNNYMKSNEDKNYLIVTNCNDVYLRFLIFTTSIYILGFFFHTFYFHKLSL